MSTRTGSSLHFGKPNPMMSANLVAVDSTGQEIANFCAASTASNSNTTTSDTLVSAPAAGPPVAAIADFVIAGIAVIDIEL